MDHIFTKTVCLTIICLLTIVGASMSSSEEVDYRRNYCDQFTLLTSGQRALCYAEEGHNEFIALKNGGQMGLKYCGHVMAFDPWNCSTEDLAGDLMSYYTLDDGVTKEAAFLTSIRAAGMYYSIRKHYQDDILECPYSKNRRPKTRTEEMEHYGKCHLAASNVVENYLRLDHSEDADETTITLNILNGRYGMQVVADAIESGEQQTGSERFWCCGLYALPPFSQVATKLHEAYRSNTKPVLLDGTGYDEDAKANFPLSSLMYAEKSQDQCRRSPSFRSGRLCYIGLNDHEARRQCREICCGNEFNAVQNEPYHDQHNCHIPANRLCCQEECQVTTKLVTKFFCTS